jgi:hypothetical protein
MRNCGNAEDFKKTQAKRKIKAPKQLPRNRPRQLTDPPLHPPRSWKDVLLRHVQQQTYDQSASLLFARLPIEVRRLIWTNVLGGNLLHIARAPKRLIAIACVGTADPQSATRKHNCWGWTSNPLIQSRTPGFYLGPFDDSPAKPANLLPLLQSCRKAYTESISILYQDNVFDLNHIDTLFYLQRSVLPQRLAEIHSLNLSWNFTYPIAISPVPYNLATWAEACGVLASLPELQTLRVRLTGGDVSPGEDRKNRWGPLLEAMKKIKSVREFEVSLPWSVVECESAARSVMYPFKLMSTEE